jgi:hypothetical protein
MSNFLKIFAAWASLAGVCWGQSSSVIGIGPQNGFTAPARGHIRSLNSTDGGLLFSHQGSIFETDANQYGIHVEEAEGVNLPASARNNIAWSQGINYNGGGGRLDSDDAALYTTFENFYHAGGAGLAMMEWHLQAITEDDVVHRIISTAFPHDGTTAAGEAGLTLSCDTFTLTGWNGDSQVVGNWTANSLRVNASTYFVGAVPTSGSHDGKYFKIEATAVADTDTIVDITGSAVTGTMNTLAFSGSATTGVVMQQVNTSTDANAHSSLTLQTNGTNSGDAKLTLTNGVNAWTVGQDNTNSDRFGIYNATAPGSSIALEFDTNEKAYFFGSIGISNNLINSDAGTNGGISFNGSNRMSVGATGTGSSGYITLLGNDAGLTSEAGKYLVFNGGTDIYIQIGGANTAQWTSTGLAMLSSKDITASGNVCLSAASTLTVASGVVTQTESNHLIAGEGAAADDLVTISGGTAGDILILRASSDSVTITVKDGTGNIQCEGDRSLDNASDSMMLLYDGTNWVEIAFANNGA